MRVEVEGIIGSFLLLFSHPHPHPQIVMRVGVGKIIGENFLLFPPPPDSFLLLFPPPTPSSEGGGGQ